ncbi:trafficking protein particle complex subunit 11 [Hordeum vulgare subsp. vulgare]|uniref:Trafficking protein particle complex subunit 11 domain-containing protein n=1 Tax=Hordeum vulgare subsp. vulgare TaxID=112509 RepID=A0A8I6YLH3_HORVV|nr:trafficking protein particle complex subunit 11 [Hordeum vulgare subsp. vulgare]
MEDYPEELRTPPVSLVSIVGCPEMHATISAALSSQQPPMNTLALPDFAKANILSRTAKSRDPLAPPQTATGILKKDWLLKHRTRVPAAVAAMFRADQVTGDPAQWLQACSDLENLKSIIQGRHSKLVVILVQTEAGDELGEEVMVALRKRAEIDSKHLIVLVESDEAERNASLLKLRTIFTELCSTYYKEEGRRIKARIEKRNFSSVELSVRYCFKVAVYAEFRRDWPEALKFYEEGVRVLREMIGTSTRLPPTQRLVEIKAVADQFHFKISTLLLHAGKVVEAIAWFRKHIRSFERVVGSPEVAFLHWEWFSRQFLVFGELIETTSTTVPDTVSPRFGTADNALTEWEFQPAYYYQLAASYLREKRCALECPSSRANLTGDSEIPDSVMSSVYVGQYVRLFEEGDTISVLPLSDAEFTSYALSEAERFQDSYEIIALFRKAYESFLSLGATRMASSCSAGMAIEYYAAGEFGNAKKLFDGVAGLYRQEGWTTLLWENLGYLRECSRKLNSLVNFTSYSLEMAALPLFSGSVQGNSENKSNGPAGWPTISRREEIQQEVVNILEGKHTSEVIDDEFNLQLTEESTQLVIDQISPLRIVLVASVAFHDQSVKPGSPMLVSVSLLSHLPSPVAIDQLEVQFNQSDCNFVMVSAQDDSSTLNSDVHGQVVHSTSLTLFSNKWMRLTHEVKSGQSGKLECLSVKAIINKHLVVCCQAESPASMEDFPLWKFEDQVETLPTKDAALAFSGQKLIQVEEPDAQVELVLDSTGPALVGELFVVPVTILSKGHAVHSGELKINLVDAKGGGLLMSPGEPDESEIHHVELIGVSTATGDEVSKEEVDNIKKIQYSFGVVSVPTLVAGDSWSCKLEIKWQVAKSLMLYVSLGYSLNSSEDASLHRLNVQRSLQVEGKIPMIVGHQFLRPFRREPLLLSRIRSSSGDDKKDSLAMKESNMLIVSARNCTEVPLRLHSIAIESDGDGKQLCSVEQISGLSDEYAVVAPSAEYKAIFSVNPRASNPDFYLGELCLNWSRDLVLGENQDSRVTMKQRLPEVHIEEPPLVVSIECPPYAILGTPFTFYVKIHNSTSLLQEIKYSLVDSQNFVFSGAHNHAAFILPKTEHTVSHKLVPLGSGSQQLPRITVTSVRYSAALTPPTSATSVFVYPSEPKFNLEKSHPISDECVS